MNIFTQPKTKGTDPMKKLGTIALALLVTTSAHAGLVYSTPTSFDDTIFDSFSHGLLGDVTVGGMTFSGDALVESGNNPGYWAIPGSHNALVLTTGKTETVTFDHLQSHSLIYWWTADAYEGVVYNNGVEITGGMLSAAGFSVNPEAGAANLSLDISGFGGVYSSATFYATGNSFEFVPGNDGPAPISAPETSTWVMMLCGFASLVFVKRWRLA